MILVVFSFILSNLREKNTNRVLPQFKVITWGGEGQGARGAWAGGGDRGTGLGKRRRGSEGDKKAPGKRARKRGDER